MTRPSLEDVRIFPGVAEFHRWLEEHHATERELWVGYYRKGSGKTSITYREAVEEGLCFGWIDGLTYRINDKVYTNRFTPRTTRSTWSAINVARMHDLIAAGRAHPAGIRAFEAWTAGNTDAGG